MDSQRYVVLTLIGHHYENVWELDGEPEVFESAGEAEAALAEHLRECQWAVDAGHLDDMPTRDQFHVAPYVGEVAA